MRLKSLLSVSLTGLLLLSMAMVVLVSASSTTMSVVPPSIINTNLGPTKTFSVDVVALNVTNLYLFEFKLWYDTSILTATGITPGPEFSDPSYTFPFKMDIDDTIGLVWVGITRGAPLTGVSGDILLAKIDFTVDAWGESTLNLEDTILGDYTFPYPQPIPHDVVDGYFNNVGVIVRDIAVVNVTTSATEAYPTWTVPLVINVTVLNEGNSTETFNVNTYYNLTATSWVAIGTLPVTSLAPGNSTILTFNWNLSGVPPSVVGGAYTTYAIKAEAVVANDADPADNTLVSGAVKVKIAGDANGDLKVNIFDLAILGKAWGTSFGGAGYDPRVDFNRDNVVNVYDLAILASKWGYSG